MRGEIKPSDDVSFISEIAAIPGGEGIRLCIQCGTCTASCPNAEKMEHTPSELIAMARAGMRKEVLASNAMWFCLSCYMCTVRCPRGIRQTDLMHILAYLSSLQVSSHRGTLTPTMDHLFNRYASSTGNLPELRFIAHFYLKTNPFRAWQMLPVAFNLLKRGRLSLRRRKLTPAGAKQLDTILEKARSLGGT
jgi:heterodisulfide reductase subunit C